VSQDLKALSILLNGQPLIFNIDLACLAARRGYLKLDKWMSDRIRDHGELFITTVVAFLRKKVPQLNTNNLNLLKNNDPIPQVQMPLLPETVQTILKCIGTSSSSINMSAELSQEIFQMNLQAKILLDKPNLLIQQQQQQQQQQQRQPQQLLLLRLLFLLAVFLGLLHAQYDLHTAHAVSCDLSSLAFHMFIWLHTLYLATVGHAYPMLAAHNVSCGVVYLATVGHAYPMLAAHDMLCGINAHTAPRCRACCESI